MDRGAGQAAVHGIAESDTTRKKQNLFFYMRPFTLGIDSGILEPQSNHGSATY